MKHVRWGTTLLIMKLLYYEARNCLSKFRSSKGLQCQLQHYSMHQLTHTCFVSHALLIARTHALTAYRKP
jgi:hypothetical protein